MATYSQRDCRHDLGRIRQFDTISATVAANATAAASDRTDRTLRGILRMTWGTGIDAALGANRKRVQRLMALRALEALFPRPRPTIPALDAPVYLPVLAP